MKKTISINFIKDCELREKSEDFWEDCEIDLCLLDKFANECARVRFISLLDDLKSLVRGFLKSKGLNPSEVEVKDKEIRAKFELKDSEILSHLRQKELIQTCESIIKHEDSKVVIPFNSAKCVLKMSEILDYLKFLDSDLNGAFRAKIINESASAEGFDTNPKNAIYKALGKISGEMCAKSVLLMDFGMDIEALKIILCHKVTFAIFRGKSSFFILKTAQKFGVTLISLDSDISILTHKSRVLD